VRVFEGELTMTKLLVTSCALFMLLAGVAQADEPTVCKGNITSKQGEGMVVKTFHFEVTNVVGSDLKDVLEKCKKIAQQRQNKAGRANPGLAFKRSSDLDLICTRGGETLQVRRALQTLP
jgi:hypothetical protein